MKLKSFKRLLVAAFAATVSAGAALAEGTSGAVVYAGSTAETIVNDASTTLQNFLTGAAPTVAAVIIAGLAIWGGIKLVGILKSAFQTGKGR